MRVSDEKINEFLSQYNVDPITKAVARAAFIAGYNSGVVDSLDKAQLEIEHLSYGESTTEDSFYDPYQNLKIQVSKNNPG